MTPNEVQNSYVMRLFWALISNQIGETPKREKNFFPTGNGYEAICAAIGKYNKTFPNKGNLERAMNRKPDSYKVGVFEAMAQHYLKQSFKDFKKDEIEELQVIKKALEEKSKKQSLNDDEKKAIEKVKLCIDCFDYFDLPTNEQDVILEQVRERYNKLIDTSSPPTRFEAIQKDLADLKEQLQNQPKPSPKPRPILEKAPLMIGDARQKDLVRWSDYLLQNPPLPLGIIGTGGLGKTNFALNLLHQEAIKTYFGDHRYMVRCDAAHSKEAFLTVLAASLPISLESDQDVEHTLISFLQSLNSPVLLLIDNFETLYQHALQDVAPLLERVETLTTLVFTMRTNTPPQALDWSCYHLPDLATHEAMQLFHHHTNQTFVGNATPLRFVQDIEALPLAVELIAKRARGLRQLDTLYAEWQKHKTLLLKIASREKKKTSIFTSLSRFLTKARACRMRTALYYKPSVHSLLMYRVKW